MVTKDISHIRIGWDRRGFSMIEALIGLAIGIFTLSAAYFVFNTVLKEIYKVESNIGRMGSKVELRNMLENTCVQVNSMTHPDNNLSCLSAGTCAAGMTGSLKVFDDKAQLFNDPGITKYDKNLHKCTTALTSCMTTLSSSYRVVCAGAGCKTPDILMQMNFQLPATTTQPATTVDSFEIAVTFPTTYRNCQEAFAAGNTISDLYLLDPDGNGGLCPFKVYCDMQPSTGRARALIGRAATHGYTELPRVQPPLEFQGLGLLQQEYITALYNTLGPTRKMTVDVEEAATGNLTIHLGIANVGQTQQLANATYCEYNNTSLLTATGTTSSEFKIGAQSNTAFVGFSTQVTNGKTMGFSCSNCSADYTCSLGSTSCCQQQLKGALWLE